MKNKRMLLFLSLLIGTLLFSGLFCAAQAEGGQVSGQVWLDKDGDGLIGSERVLASVQVSLHQVLPGGESQEVMSSRTNDDGFYAFSIAEEGDYYVSFYLPDSHQFTRHGLDSHALPAMGRHSQTPVFHLAGGDVLTMNAGGIASYTYVALAAFEDENLNGGRRDSEPRIRNVKIELLYDYNGTTYTIAEGLTNKDGELRLQPLSPATYTVRATLPENYVAGPLGSKTSVFYNCMQPSIDNVCTTAPFTLEPKANIGIGIGCVTTGTLNGTLWQDDNGNQLRDASENGCVDAMVSLYAQSLNITRTASVNPDGTFTFTGLQPAQYELIFDLPEGMIFANSGDSLLRSIASRDSIPVQVFALETTTASPVGATMASRVEIAMKNISPEEPLPLANVQGQFVQNGEVIGTAVSDENGLLVFPIARSGEGTVSITLPQPYILAEDGGIFPFEKVGSDAAATIQVPLNGTFTGEGLAIESASVSGLLVEDATNTGYITAECMPLSGFTVQAIDASGNAVLETVTNEQGEYTLAPLMPATYYIRFLLDDRYIATPCLSDESSEHNAIYIQEPLFGETDAIVLYDGQQKTSVNGALFRAGSVEGTVLLNPELNQLATHAGGAAGITVTLLDEDLNPWQDYAYDITDENGFFCIKGILPGTYSLEYELPSAHAFVAPESDSTLYIGEQFTIENGSQIQQSPIGVVKTSTLGGRMADYTTGEGVSAQLTLMSLLSGESITLEAATDGRYTFDGLLPGDYLLNITLKGGYLFADSPDSFMPYLNDSAAAVVLSLPMGTVEENCNIIASQPVNWAVTLFNDANENGKMDEDETPAPGRTLHLSLRNDAIGTYTSDASGVVHLTGLIPAQYTATVDLLDREYFSMNPYENTETINADGLAIALHQQSEITGQVWCLDGTKNGVAGIRIILVLDGTEVASTTTDENGVFSFEKLHRGDYQLRAELPQGYLFARMQDASTRTSYIISQTDGSLLFGLIPLQYGQQFTGVDIGIGGMGAIGDTAWLDENKNGMQDIDEPLLPGIIIELYQHGILVQATKTDAYGRYSLSGLYPGSYEMHVTMPKEIKPTIEQTEFPLVASILPQTDDTVAIVDDVIVPSMGRNLNYDLGFVLKKKNVYPDIMDDIATKDWTPYGRTEED